MDIEAILKEEEELSKIVYIEDGFIIFKGCGVDHSFEYTISLLRCSTHQAILKWSYHLTEKTWITIPMLNRFIILATQEHNLRISLY